MHGDTGAESGSRVRERAELGDLFLLESTFKDQNIKLEPDTARVRPAPNWGSPKLHLGDLTKSGEIR